VCVCVVRSPVFTEGRPYPHMRTHLFFRTVERHPTLCFVFPQIKQINASCPERREFVYGDRPPKKWATKSCQHMPQIKTNAKHQIMSVDTHFCKTIVLRTTNSQNKYNIRFFGPLRIFPLRWHSPCGNTLIQAQQKNQSKNMYTLRLGMTGNP